VTSKPFPSGAPRDDRRRSGSATTAALVAAASATVALVLLATASRYGFHRDELYFMSNAENPAWGYVDHPPLTPMVGWVSQQLFGDSVLGLRVIPAAVGAGIVALTAAISREVGGGGGAQVLAAWSAATSVAVLAVSHMLTTPTLDVLTWTAALWVLCRVVRTADVRWFLLLGVIAGIGLMNKLTFVLAPIAFGVGLLATPQRRLLANGWAAAGAGVALLIAAPHLWWQVDRGWPILELGSSISDEATENRVLMLPFQLLFLGLPIAVAVIVTGWRQLRKRTLVPYRFVPIGFVALLALLLLAAGKPYYAAGALPALIALAATDLVDWCRRHRAVVGSLLVANAAVSVLFALPILPAEQYVESPVSALNSEPAEMIGWPEFVDQVATYYGDIDDGQRTTVVLTGNYGEAGAIDHYGAERGLPAAYSGHNSYADVRVPPGEQGPVLVVGYGDPRRLLSGCARLGAIVMPNGVDNEEQGTPIWRCTRPLRPWAELWPDVRHIS
jgi:4-amino-4-deoxy-L-arabinose transferase-like glycosyltransferase